MKAKLAAPLFLTLFVCLSVSAASPEEDYLAARNAFIEKFDKAKEKQVLGQLEKQLRAIIGAVNIEEFPSQGKINLQTLDEQADFGFGNVDGLRFSNRTESFLVTTPYLLKLYFEKTPKPAKDLPELNLAALASDGKFLESAFGWNAVVTIYAELPVRSMAGSSLARAFLGLGAQDVGPFIPDTLFVTVVKGDRIFLAHSPAASKFPDLLPCTKEWDRLARDENKAFSAFTECYGREVKVQPAFMIARQQAQSIIERLQKDPAASKP